MSLSSGPKKEPALTNMGMRHDLIYKLCGPLSRLPRWLGGKEFTWQCRRCRRRGFNPWVRMIPWSRKWQPIPVFLPGKSHGQRLVGCSPWDCKESDMTEHTCTHGHLWGRLYMGVEWKWDIASKKHVTYHASGTSLVVQWLRLCAAKAGGLGSIPAQGTRSHMPQLRSWMSQLKISNAAIKDPGQPNKYTNIF